MSTETATNPLLTEGRGVVIRDTQGIGEPVLGRIVKIGDGYALVAIGPERAVQFELSTFANPAPEPQRGTLGGMRPGDVCWAVPWALSADGDRLWLDAEYLAGSAPGGTATVRVERRPDGYHAWSEPGEEVYVNEAVRPGKNSGRHYLPVTWHSGYPGVRVRVIKLEPKRTR